MLYKQTVNNIKVVILSLDGGLLDLNRLRFNYFKRICQIHNYDLTKANFEASLGNLNTMYNNFPIINDINVDDTNDMIEHDLFEYAKLKPISIIKEGCEELLQFFKQKNIKVAVITTHKIKRAIQYLQLTKLYDKVDFIIGGDNSNPPLPDPFLLTTILEQLNVEPKNTLVVANYPNLLYAANQKFLNIIYINDLCPANSSIESRVYKIAKNNFDVMNYVLFARYDSMEMYSPLLGMSSDMNLETLKQTYFNLLKEYQNDPQLIDLVRDTYHYFLGEIINDGSSEQDTAFFDNEDSTANSSQDSLSIIDNSELINEGETYQPIKRFEFSDDDEDSLEKEEIKTTRSKNITDDDPEEINKLMDIINGEPEQKEVNEIPEQKTEATISKKRVVFKPANFLYTVINTTLITFAGLIVYISFEDIIHGPGILAGMVEKIIDFYVNSVLSVYSFIFNNLNYIFSSIPNYENLIAGNNILSTLAVKLILFTIFNIIIVYIFKFIRYQIKKKYYPKK